MVIVRCAWHLAIFLSTSRYWHRLQQQSELGWPSRPPLNSGIWSCNSRKNWIFSVRYWISFFCRKHPGALRAYSALNLMASVICVKKVVFPFIWIVKLRPQTTTAENMCISLGHPPCYSICFKDVSLSITSDWSHRCLVVKRKGLTFTPSYWVWKKHMRELFLQLYQ